MYTSLRKVAVLLAFPVVEEAGNPVKVEEPPEPPPAVPLAPPDPPFCVAVPVLLPLVSLLFQPTGCSRYRGIERPLVTSPMNLPAIAGPTMRMRNRKNIKK